MEAKCCPMKITLLSKGTVSRLSLDILRRQVQPQQEVQSTIFLALWWLESSNTQWSLRHWLDPTQWRPCSEALQWLRDKFRPKFQIPKACTLKNKTNWQSLSQVGNKACCKGTSNSEIPYCECSYHTMVHLPRSYNHWSLPTTLMSVYTSVRNASPTEARE